MNTQDLWSELADRFGIRPYRLIGVYFVDQDLFFSPDRKHLKSLDRIAPGHRPVTFHDKSALRGAPSQGKATGVHQYPLGEQQYIVVVRGEGAQT